VSLGLSAGDGDLAVLVGAEAESPAGIFLQAGRHSSCTGVRDVEREREREGKSYAERLCVDLKHWVLEGPFGVSGWISRVTLT
jgi:hypothetical protein